MMRFKLLSDLHLEFYRGRNLWVPEELPGDKDTVLILAGDIDTGVKAYDWIKDRCAQYKHVIYILGNHEFYGNEWFTVHNFWKRLDGLLGDNFTFLEQSVLHLEDVRILGCTLWTRMDDQVKDLGIAMWQAAQTMNDYCLTDVCEVKGLHTRKLKPQDTISVHQRSVKFLDDELSKWWDGSTIVVTHHLPHNDCVSPQFRGSETNAFFVTHLDDLIKKHDIDIWCHGHTHDNVDIERHGTRILCNPKGYFGHEINTNFNEDLIFEC